MSRRKQAPNTDERILAGKILIDPHGLKGLNIEPEDIQDGKCRRVVATIQRLYVQGRIPTNGNFGVGWLQQVEDEGGGALEILSGLVEDATTADNIGYTARKVMKAGTWRRIRQEAEDGKDPEKVQALLTRLQKPTGIEGMEIVSVSDLLSREERSLEWIWHGILPLPGTSIIGAKAKTGKSTFGRVFGLAVSRGTSFLDRPTINAPIPTVYFAFEGDEGRFTDELRRMGAGHEPFYVYHGLAPPNFADLLEGIITEYCAGLIIIDTLYKAFRVSKIKDYEEVVPHLEKTEWIARSKGCHVMFIHHARKGDATNLDADELLGSVAFSAGVDTVILLKKHPYGRTFRTVQRYGEDVGETLVQLNADGYLTLGESVYEAEMEAIWNEIGATVFTGSDSLTEADIKDRAPTKYRNNEIQKALRWALQEGLIDRSGGGKRGDPYQYRLFDLHGEK